MVGVRMGEQDRVDLADVEGEGLHPKLRGRVDQDRVPGLADEDRGPEPLVERVRRPADIAIAADHGHPVGGARAED